MGKLGENSYGDDFAEVYDELYADRDDPRAVSEVLAALAGNGSVLEFGIGTGRLALPLSERGLKVYGIDNSQKMLLRLKAKPGAEQIVAVHGDCVEDLVEREGFFSLVFFAFSTIFQFLSQEIQVQCFRNAARHLRPGGVFVVETFIHDRSRWRDEQEVSVVNVAQDFASVRVGLLDPASQIINTQRMDFTPNGVSFLPNKIRFIYPSEMDLMARLAGFRMRERWSDWTGEPFTSKSGTQVVVYEKVSEGAA
jgi:SAM-dependent methyltransferase